jgi:hypothetical protein
MISDAQARSLLQAAGEDVAVTGPDPDVVIAGTRRARRRRVLFVMSAAAAVALVVGGGLVLRPHLGVGSKQRLQTTHGSRTAPIINTWKAPSNVMLDARVGGVLEVSEHGCLIVRHGGTITDVVWPYGFSTATGADGRVVVLDRAGHPVVRVGQSFTAAGGSIPGVHNLACRADPTRSDVMSVDGEITAGPR